MELKIIFVFLKKHSSARSATDNKDFLFRLLCVNITSHNPPLFRRCEMLFTILRYFAGVKSILMNYEA